MNRFQYFICLLVLSTIGKSFFVQGQASEDEETDPERLVVRHPYIVNIRGFGRSVCTGVLVDLHTVVTAAQCVDPRLGRDVHPTLWLNSTESLELSENGFIRETVETVFHPNYTGSSDDGYNVAMLRLNESSHAQDAVPLGPPLRILPVTGFPVLPGRDALLTLGFGRTSLTGPSASRLQIGEVEVVEPARCIDADIGFLEDQMFCVDSVLSCSQDVGGPLFFGRNIGAESLFGLASGTRCFENIDLTGVLNLATVEAVGWLRTTRDEFEASARGVNVEGPLETEATERGVNVNEPETEATASAESPETEETDIEERIESGLADG